MPVISFSTLDSSVKHFYVERFHFEQDVELHSHDFIELCYVEEGSLFHHSAIENREIHPGDYFIIEPQVSHALRWGSGHPTVINCIFRPAFLDASLHRCDGFDTMLQNYLIHFDKRFHFRPHSGVVFQDDTGEIADLLCRMNQEYPSSKPGSLELLRAYLIAIIILTLRKLEVPETKKSFDILQVQQAIRERYPEPLRLTDLAKELHISVPHLSRKFSTACGWGFKEYLQQVRMEEACRLLANSDDKIADIAVKVGYQDLKFFNALFLKTQGQTPSAFRRTHQTLLAEQVGLGSLRTT